MRIRIWGLRRNRHGVRAEGIWLSLHWDYFSIIRTVQTAIGGYHTYYPIHIRWAKNETGRRWFQINRLSKAKKGVLA